MRTMRWLGGLALVLGLCPVAVAQTVLYQAKVNVTEAVAHSGPSDALYATNRLKQGQVVRVLQERPDGWLAIEPPPGSFSWVRVSDLERSKNGWIVTSDTEALIGSELVPDKPSVRGPKLPRGFQLRGLNRQITDQGVVWQAVEPPDGKEVRYVLARDLERAASPGVVTAMAPPGSIGSASTPLAGDAISAQAGRVEPPTQYPQWGKAQAAWKAGRISEAIDQFEQLGQQLSSTNHAQAVLCYNEAAYLRSLYSGSVGTAYRPGDPTPARSSTVTSTAYTPTTQPQTIPSISVGTPSSTAPQVQQSSYNLPSTTSVQGQWSGSGRLRKSGRPIDGQQAYVLETSGRQIMMYVTPQSGMDLQQYVGSTVQLHGPLVYRGDLRSNYMVADYVTPSQQ